MPSNFWGPLLGSGITLAGGVLGQRAAGQASGAQVAAGDAAIREIRPYAQAGTDALGRLNNPTAYQQSPGYQFALDQQQKQLQQSAAARGGLYSGRTLDALQRNAIGYANQDYNNWWNQQAGLANMGANAAGNIGNVLVGQGNARAEGIGAGANSLNSALGSIGGQLADYLTNRGVAAAGSAAAPAGFTADLAAGLPSIGLGGSAAGTAAAGSAAAGTTAAAASPYAGMAGLGLAGMGIAGALILRDAFKKDPAVAGAKFDSATRQLQLGQIATGRDSPLGLYTGKSKNAGNSIAATYGVTDEEVWNALQPALEAYSSAQGSRGQKIDASKVAMQAPARYEEFKKIMALQNTGKGGSMRAGEVPQRLINAGFSKQDVIQAYAYWLASGQKNGLATGKNDIFKALDRANQYSNNQRVIGA